jgi:hypothetical protein
MPRKGIMNDDVHPNAEGHRLIGQGLVAFTMRSTLQQELARIVAGRAPVQRPSLPHPVTPLAALEADGDTFCAEGRDMFDYVDQSTVATGGWNWTNSAKGNKHDAVECRTAKAAQGDRINCGNWGFDTHGFGKYLDFQIDTQNMPGDAISVASGTQPDKRQLMFFYDRCTAPNADVGTSGKAPTALVQCVSGCECKPFRLGGDAVTYSEYMAATKAQVRVRIFYILIFVGIGTYMKMHWHHWQSAASSLMLR